MAPSVTVTTHPFKRINDDLTLNLEIFQKTSSLDQSLDPLRPVVLFLHGGGFVGFNREHVPPHVVQMALLRDWLLVSADYRLLPQVKGADIFDDVKDAYRFVREELVGLLSQWKDRGVVENVVVIGQSAGEGTLPLSQFPYFDLLVHYCGFLC
jgi:acetyl esterase/lipase